MRWYKKTKQAGADPNVDPNEAQSAIAHMRQLLDRLANSNFSEDQDIQGIGEVMGLLIRLNIDYSAPPQVPQAAPPAVPSAESTHGTKFFEQLEREFPTEKQEPVTPEPEEMPPQQVMQPQAPAPVPARPRRRRRRYRR